MSRPDKAFWVTVIPAVILWNTLRVPLLTRIMSPFELKLPFSLPGWALGNVVFGILLAGAAGYVAALVGAPRRIAAGANVAFGVTVVFGLQNYIDYRHAVIPGFYYILLPLIVALAAVLGAILCAFTRLSSTP